MSNYNPGNSFFAHAPDPSLPPSAYEPPVPAPTGWQGNAHYAPDTHAAMAANASDSDAAYTMLKTAVGLSALPLTMHGIVSAGAAATAGFFAFSLYQKHLDKAREWHRTGIQKRNIIELRAAVPLDAASTLIGGLANTMKAASQGWSPMDVRTVALRQQKIIKNLCRKRSRGQNTLFDPHPTRIDTPRKFVAACAFLTVGFLELPATETWPCYLSRSQCDALRDATISLSEHPFFREHWPEDPRGEVKRSCRAVFAFLDILLGWQPIDPFSIAGYSHVFGVMTYRKFSKKVVAMIRRMFDGDEGVKVQLLHHLERRPPIQPTSCLASAWTDPPPDASLIVRNWSPVPLHVRLYRKGEMPLGGLTDLPLIGFLFENDPIMITTVSPKKEWALRPKVCDGQTFDVQLKSGSGTVIGENRMERGEIFDFDVTRPSRSSTLTKQLKLGFAEDKQAQKSTSDAEKPRTKRDPRYSVSTHMPSSMGDTIGSDEFEVSAWQNTTSSAEKPTPQRDAMGSVGGSIGTKRVLTHKEVETQVRQKCITRVEKPTIQDAMGSVGGSIGTDVLRAEEELAASVCPQCWCVMPRMLDDVPRDECNEGRSQLEILLAGTGESYDNGVDCDACGAENLETKIRDDGHPEPYYHCGTCRYDLCKPCAMKEMINVWWT